MNRRGRMPVGSATAAVVLALLAFSPARGDAPDCTSSGCHATLVARSHPHEATESCDNCHESVATPHPQKGVKTFRLTAQPPELCFNCHDPFPAEKVAHEPVTEGMCTTCHDPHGSDQPKLLASPPGQLCRDCHSEVGDAPHPHGPVAAGDCTTCHRPHGSPNRALLVKDTPELCFDCHGEVKSSLAAKKVVHGAIDAGCESCHSPHGSDQPKLLTERMGPVCFECHDDIGAKIEKASTVHPALASEKGCATCHAPHASDNPKLLLRPQGDTCLGCHPQIVTAQMTTLHPPVADGECTACHDPHAADNPKLFARAFPQGHYVAYDEKAFALCFECHDAAMARYPETSFATGFRDGERNLHYLHVNNPQKGRSCVMCHAVHGADNEVLIAKSVPFGKWQLPLGFQKTENGGSCAPGCHQPQSYDRTKKSAPAAPASSR